MRRIFDKLRMQGIKMQLAGYSFLPPLIYKIDRVLDEMKKDGTTQTDIFREFQKF